MVRMKRSNLLVWFSILAICFMVIKYAFFDKPLLISWFFNYQMIDYLTVRPEKVSELGFDNNIFGKRYQSRLNDYSYAFEQSQQKKLRDASKALHQYDRDKYRGENLLSYDVMDYYINSNIKEEEWILYNYYVNQLNGIHIDLPKFLMRYHSLRDLDSIYAFFSRLKLFPQAFQQTIDKIRLRANASLHQPKFSLVKAHQQIMSFIAEPVERNLLFKHFEDALSRLPQNKVSTEKRKELTLQIKSIIQKKVYPAYRKLALTLEDEIDRSKGNHGVWAFSDGDAYYQYKVRFHTSTYMSADEVHQLGSTQVSLLRDKLDEALSQQGLNSGTIGQRIKQIANLHSTLTRSEETIIAHAKASYEVHIEKAQNVLKDMFHYFPDEPLIAMPIPEYKMASAHIAYYKPPLRSKAKPGVIYFNARDSVSNSKIGIATLAHHEGIPGHHSQHVINQQLELTHQFRRSIEITAFTEGWAQYAEQLANEAGLLNDPLDYIGYLQFEMLRASRLVVDTGIHHLRWTREQCVDFLIQNTGLSKTDAIAEVEKYFVFPGQALSYTIGKLKILELRDKALACLGDNFDLRDFHQEILGHGVLPLKLLENVVDQWLAGRCVSS